MKADPGPRGDDIPSDNEFVQRLRRPAREHGMIAVLPSTHGQQMYHSDPDR